MAVARTTTGGTSWSRHILESPTVGFTYSIAFDPSNSSVLYAAGHVNLLAAVFKTTNSGLTWSRCDNGITGIVYTIAVDPANSSILYAGTVDGVHKSTNGGVSWENVGAYGVRSVVVDPAQPSTVYAGTSLGVYVSTNNGVDWFEQNQGMATKSVLCVSKIAGTPLYAGTEGYSIYEWQEGSVVTTGPSQHVSGMKVRLFPNPTTHAALLEYTLTQPQPVRIGLYDRTGRLLERVFNGWKSTGQHQAELDVKTLPAGVYFVGLTYDDKTVFTNFAVLR